MPDERTESQNEAEVRRILEEYDRRARTIPTDHYLPTNASMLFVSQERTRVLYSLLRHAGFLPLESRRLLEIGCGTGNWLAEFEAAGVKRKNIAAIELNPDRAAAAQARFAAFRDDAGKVVTPGADIRVGDATALPWPDASFDLVLQSTVFTSILDAGMRRQVAAEMMRVTRPGGAILWYDFFVDNPWNASVRGVRAAEIRSLFPRRRVMLRRVTLAPPIARRIVPLSWTIAHLLAGLRLLNTHYVGLIRS